MTIPCAPDSPLTRAAAHLDAATYLANARARPAVRSFRCGPASAGWLEPDRPCLLSAAYYVVERERAPSASSRCAR